MLGGLVGARRPTVTLAWAKLAERGSLLRLGDEWLIVAPAATPMSTEAKAPQPAADGPTGFWAAHIQSSRAQRSLGALIQRVR
jgi:hypothetical protein